MVDALRLAGARATGLDVNEQAIEYARARFPRCDFHWSSFETFSATEPYDFVYCSELIEHVAELERFMALLARITRNGSHVFITTPDIGSKNVPTRISDWDVFAPPFHVQFFRESNLRLLFQRHGFVAVRRFRDHKAGLKVLFRRNA